MEMESLSAIRGMRSLITKYPAMPGFLLAAIAAVAAVTFLGESIPAFDG